jgi:serine/threonine protein kinase
MDMDIDDSLPEELKLSVDSLNDMKVLRKLSASSTVHSAYHTAKKRWVVVKEDERAYHEVNLLRNLDHPHVVELFGILEPAQPHELPAVVEEYIDGKDLGEWLGADTLHWRSNGLRVCQEVAEAVTYIHSKDIAHRDIKPGVYI